MTKEISAMAHGATRAENIFEHHAGGIGKALLGFVTSALGAVREWAERRSAEKRQRQTELFLNNLPAATRRDINWPARRSEIFPEQGGPVLR